jgi:hypothetical protein
MHKIVFVLAALAVACGSSSARPPDSVTLATAINGPGAVALQPPPDACTTCSAGEYRYARGTAVSVVAVPEQGAALTTWGGACGGTAGCTVRLDADKTLVAVFGRNSAAVGVQLTGDGQGAVTSAPAGIDCGGLCTAQFTIGSTVTLTAAPQAGSTFAGWSGACSGSGTCVVDVDRAHSVSALFTRTTASVAAAHSGPGTVLSAPAGIVCGAACIAEFAQGTQVTLNAVADANAVFTGWSGACTGTATCLVAAGSGALATANFSRPQHLISTSTAGAGTGSVLSAPAGISCAGSCSAAFDQGSTATLVASPDPGSVFAGWSGDCAGLNACILGIDADKSVVASFAPAPAVVTPNPIPTLTAFSPNQVVAGSTGVVVTMSGLNFLPSTIAFWNGLPRATRFADGNTLLVSLLDADVAVATDPLSVVFLQVGTPAPGGGISAPLQFSVVNPTPTLTSIDPPSATLNSTPFQLTLTGTNFVPTSQVLFNAFLSATTIFVSPTQLLVPVSAQTLASAQPIQISVSNGSVSRTSNSLPFSVNNPPPLATSMSPSRAVAGSDGVPLTIYGTQFSTNPSLGGAIQTVIRWNGANLVTTVFSSGELRAQVPAAFLAAPGTAQVTVFTSGPGGGETVPLPFTVFAPAPEATSFEPDSVTEGAASFALTIHGHGFDAGTTVSWNSAVRSATLLGPTALQIDVAAADVATAGSAAIAISNANGASPVTGFPIRARTPAIASRIAVPVPAKDLAWDASRRLFYASVGSTAPANGNSIAVIDTAGAVVASIPTGSEPGRLSLSDDASKLYVALDGAALVQRIDVASRTIDLEIVLGPSSAASDLQAMPGSAGTVAVARRNPNLSPGSLGVVVFDEGVPRPEATASFGTLVSVMAFAGPDAIYGYDGFTTAFTLSRMQVIATGVVFSHAASVFNAFGIDIRHDSGRIYSSNGAVADLHGIKIGSFALPSFQSASVQPDWAHGRVFFLSGTTLSAFNAGSFVPAGSLSLADSSVVGRFVRWDADGIAYRTGSQVILIRSSLIGG